MPAVAFDNTSHFPNLDPNPKRKTWNQGMAPKYPRSRDANHVWNWMQVCGVLNWMQVREPQNVMQVWRLNWMQVSEIWKVVGVLNWILAWEVWSGCVLSGLNWMQARGVGPNASVTFELDAGVRVWRLMKVDVGVGLKRGAGVRFKLLIDAVWGSNFHVGPPFLPKVVVPLNNADWVVPIGYPLGCSWNRPAQMRLTSVSVCCW